MSGENGRMYWLFWLAKLACKPKNVQLQLKQAGLKQADFQPNICQASTLYSGLFQPYHLYSSA